MKLKTEKDRFSHIYTECHRAVTELPEHRTPDPFLRQLRLCLAVSWALVTEVARGRACVDPTRKRVVGLHPTGCGWEGRRVCHFCHISLSSVMFPR